MARYRCTGLNAAGQHVSELFDTDDPNALAEQLNSNGWSELAVRPAESQSAGPLSSEDLITLGEELAAMSRAALPLDRALASLSQELGGGRLSQVVEQLADHMRAGLPLEEALRRQEPSVPPAFAALAAAGVRTGRLHEILTQLNHYARTTAELRLRLLGAMLYPLVVLLVGIALFVFGMVFIAPQFEPIYEDFNIRLPMITRLAIVLSRNPLVQIVAPLAVLLVGSLLIWFVLRRSTGGQRLLVRLSYSFPLWGVLVQSIRMASFSNLLALLVEHEVPLSEAVSIAGRASPDAVLGEACQRVSHQLQQGRDFGQVLAESPEVPNLFTCMVGPANRRGMLLDSLRQVGEVYEQRGTVRAALLRSIVPPLLIVGIGATVVGFFVLAYLLPMIKIIEDLSK